MDGITLSDYMGATFARLVGEPLSAAGLLALNRSERAMYVIAKIKLSRNPLLIDDNTNMLRVPLRYALQVVCPSFTGAQVNEVALQLVEPGRGWMREIEEARVVTRKSDNITTLLIAVLIYNEGGWVRYGGEVCHKLNPR